jgi:hypothetical protein
MKVSNEIVPVFNIINTTETKEKTVNNIVPVFNILKTDEAVNEIPNFDNIEFHSSWSEDENYI